MIDFPGKTRRARLRSVTVTAISPTKYPQFSKDRENPFSSQSEEVRLGEIVEICGAVLAQTSLEAKTPEGEVKAA